MLSSLIQNILTACDRLDANKNRLVWTELWPRIPEMNEDEVTYTTEKLKQREDDEETEEVLPTLLFIVDCLKDMHFFFLIRYGVKKKIPSVAAILQIRFLCFYYFFFFSLQNFKGAYMWQKSYSDDILFSGFDQ